MSVAPTGLSVEHNRGDVTVDTPKPRFSWQSPPPAPDQQAPDWKTQSAYRICVGHNPESIE